MSDEFIREQVDDAMKLVFADGKIHYPALAGLLEGTLRILLANNASCSEQEYARELLRALDRCRLEVFRG